MHLFLNFSLRKLTFILALLFTLNLTSQALALDAFVYWVIDGDSLKTITEEFDFKTIRLYGVDCPESEQPYGVWARIFTLKMCLFRVVSLKPVKKDRYGRTVAIVKKDGENLEKALLDKGLAWVYAHYCKKPICKQYYEIEQRAQKRQAGLWEESNPIPPWDWRRGQRPDSGWRFW